MFKSLWIPSIITVFTFVNYPALALNLRCEDIFKLIESNKNRVQKVVDQNQDSIGGLPAVLFRDSLPELNKKNQEIKNLLLVAEGNPAFEAKVDVQNRQWYDQGVEAVNSGYVYAKTFLDNKVLTSQVKKVILAPRSEFGEWTFLGPHDQQLRSELNVSYPHQYISKVTLLKTIKNIKFGWMNSLFGENILSLMKKYSGDQYIYKITARDNYSKKVFSQEGYASILVDPYSGNAHWGLNPINAAFSHERFYFVDSEIISVEIKQVIKRVSVEVN